MNPARAMIRRMMDGSLAVLALAACTGRAAAQEATTPPAEARAEVRAEARAESGRRLNEPRGLERLTELTFGRELPQGWSKRPNDAIDFLPEPRASAPGRGIARAYYRVGFPAGSGPVRVNWDLGRGYRQLYLSFFVRLSENWQGHRSGVNKIFHLWINDRNMVYLSAQGAGAGPYAPQVRLQGIAEERPSRNLSPRGGLRIRRGQWYQWEVLLTANTPGVPNGRVQWWIDGKLAGSADGINFVKPGGRAEWGTVSWNPTWGGMGGQIGAVQWMDMDDIYISAGK